MLVPALLHVSTFDYWFESDAPAILKQLTDRFAFDNKRAHRHPLFTLALYPVVYALDRLAGLDLVLALGLTYAGLAALWAALFFVLLRLVGLRRVDSGIFTVLALVSASMVFWLPVPETFTPAALTLLVALIAVGWRERAGRLPWIACTLIAAITLSMTVTNAVAGVLVCLVVLGWTRGVTAIGASLALVAAGQFVERLLFPYTVAFFLPVPQEGAYVFNPLAGSAGDRLAGFFLHGFLIPPLQQGYTGYLSVQRAGLASMPASVLIGWALWLVLLGTGVLGLVRGGPVKLRVVLLGVLATQLAFVLVFGQETFVYALQSGPLLVAVAAFGCLTPFRRAVLAGAVLLAAVAAMENGRRFTEAAGLLTHRYECARAHAQALSVLTTPADLIVVGLPPAAAEGLIVPSVRSAGRPGTLSRLPPFPSLADARTGWELHYEHWSTDMLDEMRRAGARYFTSHYVYGMRSHESVKHYLDTHGTLVEGTPDWVIYALRSPDGAAR
ncbi:MAG TPA: DUF6080 domain-containing protein [Vicinamibacterales bacterium]|nr:DUF6080 domain-containing protein [Vicinamibacterales bacterium]